MEKIFGDCIEQFSSEFDSLEIIFTTTKDSIRKRLSNNHLSAKFVADYFSTFLPVEENNHEESYRIKESKAAVSYVANELLENAMKFNDQESKFKVKFGVYFIENTEKEDDKITAVIYAKNSLTAEKVAKFQAFLTELLASDPEELYISQVEKNLEAENSEASGLGFLTMINDYSAKLGWKFETLGAESQIYIVTTMAQVIV